MCFKLALLTVALVGLVQAYPAETGVEGQQENYIKFNIPEKWILTKSADNVWTFKTAEKQHDNLFNFKTDVVENGKFIFHSASNQEETLECEFINKDQSNMQCIGMQGPVMQFISQDHESWFLTKVHELV